MLGFKYLFRRITPRVKAQSYLDDAQTLELELLVSIENHLSAAASDTARLAVYRKRIERLKGYLGTEGTPSDLTLRVHSTVQTSGIPSSGYTSEDYMILEAIRREIALEFEMLTARNGTGSNSPTNVSVHARPKVLGQGLLSVFKKDSNVS